MKDLHYKNMIRNTFELFLILCILSGFVFCKQNKEESIVDTLTNLTILSAASTIGQCQISSANNTEYFTSGSTPTGGTVSVERFSFQSGSTLVDVYYPKNTSTSLPILVLFQGGNVHSSFYSKYAARMASEGYVVYVGNRCDLFILQYFLYPSSSLGNTVLTEAKSQNSNPASPLYARLDLDKIGFLGHSLGGVVGLYAINSICEFPFCGSGYQFLSQVKAGIFYGSGLGGSFSQSKFYKGSSGKGIPTGYIQGSLDGANKPETGLASYKNAIAIKAYFSVEGANHYGITDLNNPYGAKAESVNATLTQADQIEKISKSSILFLNTYLKGTTTITSSTIQGVTITYEE